MADGRRARGLSVVDSRDGSSTYKKATLKIQKQTTVKTRPGMADGRMARSLLEAGGLCD